MNKKSKSIKICFPSVGEDLDSNIDSRFGRCTYFVIVEVENGEILNFKSAKNIGAVQGSGAGVSAVEQISELGVDILITGDVGPKAQNILDQLKIDIVKDSGAIKDALERYINNN